MKGKELYGVLRIILGLMFLLIGITKIIDPSRMIGALGLFGAAAPLLAWIWMLSEVVFGLLLLIGWKVKYTAWPLVIILILAVVRIIIPGALKEGFNAGGISILSFHLMGIVLLISYALHGAGPWTVSKK